MMNEESIKKEIGNRLRISRKSKGLTQEYLSEKIGLQTKSYSNIETGQRLFSIEVLLKLVEVLDVSADFILTGANNYNTPITDALNSLDSKNITRIESIIQIFSEAVAERGN